MFSILLNLALSIGLWIMPMPSQVATEWFLEVPGNDLASASSPGVKSSTFIAQTHGIITHKGKCKCGMAAATSSSWLYSLSFKSFAHFSN